MSTYKYVPAIGTVKDKGVVVSKARAAWKLRHPPRTEMMVRMVRFVWMRRGGVAPANLHAAVLGACMREGYLSRYGAVIGITRHGATLLKNDRRKP